MHMSCFKDILFFQEFKNILISMLAHCRNIDGVKCGWNRMASVSLLTCCLITILENLQLRHEAIEDLLHALMLTIDVESKRCPGIDFLLIDLPFELR